MNNSKVHILDFEKNIAEVEAKIDGLKLLATSEGVSIVEDIQRLQSKLEKQIKSTYSKLSSWEKAQVARHPNRPHCLDYVGALIEDFTPLCGDRLFADDEAMIAGIGRFRGTSVVVLGQEKGHDVESRVKHNFGMAKPEGYRKAQRLMDMANKFDMPVLAFVDTAGAFPGVEGEARGQAEAIASSIEKCLSIEVPMISVVIGEGGSGGAIAIASANKVLMLEHSIYSVISPEGCSSILWRSADKVKDATEALKLTSKDLLELGVIDGVIKEPSGGAHRNHQEMFANINDEISKYLTELKSKSGAELKAERREKFMNIGRVLES